MEEVWKTVPGYENIFEVSNFGQVRSLNRIVKTCYNSHRVVATKLRKQSINKNGYKRINAGNKRIVLVHRMVALAFIPNPENKPFINHIDANPSNNVVTNLEWCTHKENMHHAIKLGRLKFESFGKKGDLCGASKLTEKEVKDIKARLLNGETVKKISKTVDKVGESAIQEIKAGRSWSHVEVKITK